MHNEAAIRSLMARQHGLVATAQLSELGVSRKVVARHLAVGRWTRVLPGVYGDTLVAPSLVRSAHAAALWAGPEALISHATAAVLHGLDLQVSSVHLWVPPRRSARSDHVVVHRGNVDRADRRMLGPIPVTSVPRTLVDLAGALADAELVAVVEEAIHRGLTTPMSIARRLDALGGTGRAGSARLRAVLGDRAGDAALEPRLEARIWRTLRSAGMRPVRQHAVRCGDRTYRIDFAFPQWRVGVEGVGDRFHRSPLQRRREQERLADLASVAWRILPVTWHDVTRAPDRVVQRVARTLAAAA